MRIRVDLPAPDAPVSATHSPASTASIAPAMTGITAPPWLCRVKLLPAPSTSITAIGFPPCVGTPRAPPTVRPSPAGGGPPGLPAPAPAPAPPPALRRGCERPARPLPGRVAGQGGGGQGCAGVRRRRRDLRPGSSPAPPDQT